CQAQCVRVVVHQEPARNTPQQVGRKVSASVADLFAQVRNRVGNRIDRHWVNPCRNGSTSNGVRSRFTPSLAASRHTRSWFMYFFRYCVGVVAKYFLKAASRCLCSEKPLPLLIRVIFRVSSRSSS